MCKQGTIAELCEIEYGTRVVRKSEHGDEYPVYGGGGETFRINRKNRTDRLVVSRFGMSEKCTRFVSGDFFLNDSGLTVSPKFNDLSQAYLDKVILAKNDEIFSLGRGSAQKNLNMDGFKELLFHYPSLAEQQRIVAKLDAAFGEIDVAIFNIEGKVRNAEKIYLNGIDAHFKNKSETLKTSKLIEISSKIGSGATPKGGKAAYKTEGISLIRSMNVHDMDFKWKDLAKIDDAQADRLSNVEICKNDVLLNITGASVARCCVVEEAALPARVNQHVAIIRPLEGAVLPNYLAYLLVSKTYKDLLLSVGEGGGATRQAITKAEIEQFKISYPSSIDEQASIVHKFDNLREQALQLKAIYNKQIKNFQSLKSAILAQELQSEAA